MVKKVNLFLILIISVFLINISSATGIVELPPSPIGSDLEIFQECNNCTDCNFTRVNYGKQTIFSNVVATQDGTHYYYTIGGGNLTTRDTLTYCYNCGNSNERETGCINVPITYNGHNLTTQTSILYISLIIFLVFILGILFFILTRLPTDVRDDQGYVLEVSKLAYLRPIVKGICWILLTAIVYICANIAIAYLDTGLLGSFLFLLYQLMMLSNLVILPLCIIYMIQRIVLSREMLGLIERGVQFQ